MTHEEARARREAIASAVAAGMTRASAAMAFGVSLSVVCLAARGIKHSRVQPPNARALRMVEMHRAGLTCQAIADRYGVSRERVRQILAKHGVTRKDGGQHVVSSSKRAARATRSQQFWLTRFGCTREECADIRAAGGCDAFRSQRRSARARGIEWGLTLRQWWDIWQTSGHWSERGRSRDKYCMARVADKGGYTVGNVYITTCRENGQEYQLRRDRSKRPAIPGVYKLYPGMAKPYVARHGRVHLGYFRTEEEAQSAKHRYVAQIKAAA